MAHTVAHLNAESVWWRQCSESVLDVRIPDPPPPQTHTHTYTHAHTSLSLVSLNGFCGRKAPCFLPSLQLDLLKALTIDPT